MAGSPAIKPKRKNKGWQELVEGLPLYKEPPENFISITSFADRANSTRTGITKVLQSGRIARKHCIACPASKTGKDNRRAVYIDWNAAGYNFIANRQEQFWPEDFELNDAKEYLPLGGGGDAAAFMNAPSEQSTGGLALEAVVDIGSAKYRVEQLKIARMQAELKLANNETIKLEDVIAHEAEQAQELKVALRQMENKVAPSLLNQTSVIEVRKILELYHREALEIFNPAKEEGEDNSGTQTKNN